jgi:hypothetical protein
MKKNPAPGGLAYWMNRLQSLNITPNFYCSCAYLTACGAGCYLSDDGRWAYVVDTTEDGEDVCMFPPVPATDEVARAVPPQDWPPLFDFIWADFTGGVNAPAGYQTSLMDYQYIYDQTLMAEAAGPAFATFRKNARKWPARSGLELESVAVVRVPGAQAQELCGEWLEAHQTVVQDVPNMLTYLLNPPPGALVRGMLDNYGYLRALIAYDINYRYVNFRYCITRPNEPFLEEYVRMLFYRSPVAQMNVGRRLINDGGVVDNPGLMNFKDRLNPIRRFESHTWTKTVN